MPRSVRYLLVALAAVLALGGSAAAQDLTTADITRLQQTVDQAKTELVTLRRTDRTTARTLETELNDLEDEVIYLKVKQRKEGRVARYEYVDLNDRLENLRARARGDASSRYGTGSRNNTPYGNDTVGTAVDTSAPGTIPVGTELDVRLSQRLSSETAQIEDRFEATTLVDVIQNGQVVIPQGSVLRGVVTDVKEAGRLERKGSLTLSFDQVRINGRAYPIRASVTQALEAGGYKEDAEKIGAGAAVGAIIGGILGGVKGAITGVLIGGGGVVAATEGKDVELPEGSVLRIRLDSALTVRGNFTRR